MFCSRLVIENYSCSESKGKHTWMMREVREKVKREVKKLLCLSTTHLRDSIWANDMSHSSPSTQSVSYMVIWSDLTDVMCQLCHYHSDFSINVQFFQCVYTWGYVQLLSCLLKHIFIDQRFVLILSYGHLLVMNFTFTLSGEDVRQVHSLISILNSITKVGGKTENIFFYFSLQSKWWTFDKMNAMFICSQKVHQCQSFPD